ncbi:hypothetical protein Taro_049462 [Colocasia esculenta]|uniref:Uncharacterized protein n=1 Tax=Colocasia esculenta TaxID=4460 RepID=A0A843XB16_COLES|nr:hypothetical protein [Colocasia esculenta]
MSAACHALGGLLTSTMGRRRPSLSRSGHDGRAIQSSGGVFGVLSPRGRRTEQGKCRLVIGLRVLREGWLRFYPLWCALVLLRYWMWYLVIVGVEVNWCSVEVCGVTFHVLGFYSSLGCFALVFVLVFSFPMWCFSDVVWVLSESMLALFYRFVVHGMKVMLSGVKVCGRDTFGVVTQIATVTTLIIPELDGKIAGRRLEILAARGLDAKFLSLQEHRLSSKYRVKRRIQDTI